MISSRKADDGGLPREILGVDFSGAAGAGKIIWIARGGLSPGIIIISLSKKFLSFLRASPFTPS
jgi:hypothetical protein